VGDPRPGALARRYAACSIYFFGIPAGLARPEVRGQ